MDFSRKTAPKKETLEFIALQIKELSDEELTRLGFKIGMYEPVSDDPAYKKVASLFTLNDGESCHDLIKEAFSIAIIARQCSHWEKQQ